jgi:hypothetical protein
MSANKGENKDFQEFGQALGREVVKLAASLKTEEVAKPSLDVKGGAVQVRFANGLEQSGHSSRVWRRLLPRIDPELP